MKNHKVSLLGMGAVLALFLATPSVASVNSWSEWMQNYYRAPQPDQIVQAVSGLSEEGAFEGAGQPAMAIGFLSAVFAQHPERGAEWMDAFRKLPEEHRRIVASALWYAGAPAGATELRAIARRTNSPALRAQLESLLARGPVAVAQTPVLSESSLNLQWGAFLASGEQQHIVNVLSALGAEENSLTRAARYSLAQKAALHSRVYEICQAQLNHQPVDVRDQMRAALAAAQGTR